MKCAELEIVLCDYLDGSMDTAGREIAQAHLAGCPGCAEMLRDMQTALAFLERVEAPEPPPELLTRILFHAPVSGEVHRAVALEKKKGVTAWFRGWFLQPRFAMGMAMTILSFSMVDRIAGISPQKLTMADLEPARVWAVMDDKVHRTWARAVKYYENLRLVYEMRARLQQWSAEEEAERKTLAGTAIEPAAPSQGPRQDIPSDGKSSSKPEGSGDAKK